MAEFDEIGGLVDYTAINTPAADDDGVGVFEALGASFRQSTTVGSALARRPVQSIWDNALPVDEYTDNAFTEADIDALPSVYQPFADRFVGVTKDGAKALRENIDGEMRDRETLGRLSFAAGLASDIAVQFLDPVNYIPIAGTTFKGASLGGKLVKGAGAGLAGAALQEPVLFATQELRAGAEVKANLYASAAFGAVFGGAAHVVELAKAHWDGPRDVAGGRALRSADEIAPLKDEVHGHIKAALQGLGYEADAAGHNADISAAAYASLARRSGADPKALAEAFKAKVLGGDAPAAASAMPQAAQRLAADLDTPEFKAWFGKSKVVDEAGKPLLVYHGTKAQVGDDFAFDFSKIGKTGRMEGAGFYFTPDLPTAQHYASDGGDLIAGYMSLKNPMPLDAPGLSRKQLEKLVRVMADDEAKANGESIASGFLSNFGDVEYDGLARVIREAVDNLMFDDLAVDQFSGLIGAGVSPELVNRAIVKALGIDGIVADGFGGEGGPKIYVALLPESIKAADNRGTFKADDPRIFHQFAGPQALTADHDARRAALVMLDKGERPEKVRKETGWFKGQDGLMRFEVSDHASTLNEGALPPLGDNARNVEMAALSEVLRHSDLFAAYPRLNRVVIRFDPELQANGTWREGLSQISLNSKLLDTPEKVKSTLLHEVQHVIQTYESFARGGNLSMGKSVKDALVRLVKSKKYAAFDWEMQNSALLRSAAEKRAMLGYVQLYRSFDQLIGYASHTAPSGLLRHIKNQTGWLYSPVLRDNAELDERVRELSRRLYAMPKRHKLKDRNAFLRDYAFDLAQVLRDAIPADIYQSFKRDTRQLKGMENAFDREYSKAQAALRPLDNLRDEARQARDLEGGARYKTPFEVYSALAGEIEARTTQRRAGMDEAARRATSPFDGTDVPVDQVIIMFGDGEINAPNLKLFQSAAGSTDSPAFKKWFDGSKVVDAEGKPLVVYHGGKAKIKAFDLRRRGSASGQADARLGFFFAQDKNAADTYASEVRSGGVTAAFLSIKNPMVVEAGAGPRNHIGLERARALGHDGVIWRQETDGGTVTDVFIAFEPAQIKSVNNGGAWDANDPRILHQNKPEAAPRGSIEFPPGGPLHGQAIIRLMGGADASTFMHESAHFFLEVMNDLHKAGGDKSAFADDIATIEAWAGARGADGRFGRDAHEKFARGFENYLRAGEAPSPALRRAFEAFKEWLVQLYATAARLDADVSPEMVKVYDRLLVPDVSEMPGAYPRSVGAAATGDMAMVDNETGEYRSMTASDFALRNAFARGVETSGVGLTPNNRAARSKVVGVKRLMADMVEDQRDTEASRQGAVSTAVETLIKNDRGIVEGKLYAIFGKKGNRIKHPTIPQAEFEERVLNAVANPDSEGDAMVRALADRVHQEVITPLETKMRDIGMLGKVQKWSQDGRYAPHNWSAGKILADLPVFKKKMGQRIGDALRKGYQTQIDKGDKRKTNLLREIDDLEMSGLRRRDEIARRMNGDEVNMTEEEIRALVMQARNKPDEKRPQSLRQFTVSRGGFWAGDPMVADLRALEYRAVGFIKNERFRRSASGDNRGGLPIDEMREAAQEAGFLAEGSTIADLLDALREDVAGRRVYSRDDLGEVQAWEAYDNLLDSLAQMGFYFDGKPVLRKTTESQRALMLKTVDALEAVDAADIAKLRAKIAEVEGEALRSNEVLNDAFDFNGEVDAILDEVVAKLTKQDALWAEDLSITIDRAGPLKRRSIDVMRNSFSEFMDNAALDAIGRHMHRMIAEYHLTKRFGRADMKHDLESLRAEAERYGETLTGADRIAFDKKMAADVAMIQVTRDQLRGTHAKGQVGFVAEAARFMTATSYMLQLGDVVTSSLGDAFRPVMAHGVGHVLRHGRPRLREGVKQAFAGLQEGDYLMSDRAGVVVERIASSRVMAMMNLEDEYHPNSKAARFSNNLAGLATRVSLMDRWNQMTKWISSGLFMDRMGEMSGRSWEELREADRAYLSINRISSHQWGYVSDMIRQNGTKDRGIWSLNFERWADRDLAETVRAAMRKDTDSLIVTPGFGDKIQSLGGVDMTGPIGSMVLQYKSFWISGHERIMLRFAQNPDAAATAGGALLMIVMGMMIDEVKAFTGNRGHAGEGYDFETRWADRNFGTMVMGGIDRAGIIPMWMEANNILERGLGLPLAYRAAGGLGMLAGAENVGDPSSRWASRNTLGSFLGPSAGVVQDGVRVVRDVAAEAQNKIFGMDNEGVSPGTVTAAKSLIPFQNAPIMRELLNWFVVPAAKAALEP